MRLPLEKLASVLFLFSAASKLVTWAVLLFFAQPKSRPLIQSAYGTLVFVLSSAELPGWQRLLFLAMALLPFVFILLAIAAWRIGSMPSRTKRWLIGLAGVATLAALLIDIDAVITSALATLLLMWITLKQPRSTAEAPRPS